MGENMSGLKKTKFKKHMHSKMALYSGLEPPDFARTCQQRIDCPRDDGYWNWRRQCLGSCLPAFHTKSQGMRHALTPVPHETVSTIQTWKWNNRPSVSKNDESKDFRFVNNRKSKMFEDANWIFHTLLACVKVIQRVKLLLDKSTWGPAASVWGLSSFLLSTCGCL